MACEGDSYRGVAAHAGIHSECADLPQQVPLLQLQLVAVVVVVVVVIVVIYLLIVLQIYLLKNVFNARKYYHFEVWRICRG